MEGIYTLIWNVNFSPPLEKKRLYKRRTKLCIGWFEMS